MPVGPTTAPTGRPGLLPFLGRDDADRGVLVRSISPLWDGSKVWLLVAGGATFAAFPERHATLFSDFYLPLFPILLALIMRGGRGSTAARATTPEVGTALSSGAC